MSRSHRHTPVTAVTTARSEKDDKRTLHGMWRCRLRGQLAHVRHGLHDPDDVPYVDRPETVLSVWAMAKDGRYYWPAMGKHPKDPAFAARQPRHQVWGK